MQSLKGILFSNIKHASIIINQSLQQIQRKQTNLPISGRLALTVHNLLQKISNKICFTSK